MKRRVVMAVGLAVLTAAAITGDVETGTGSTPAAQADGTQFVTSAPKAQLSTPSSSTAAREVRPLARPRA